MTDAQNDRPVESEPVKPEPTPLSTELVPIKPDRGAAVLAMGIVGIVSAPIWLVCCAPLGVVSIVLGILAWVMGSRDLKEMQSGLMDPGRQDITQAGQVCGIIATILGGLVLLMFPMLFVIIIIVGVLQSTFLNIPTP